MDSVKMIISKLLIHHEMNSVKMMSLKLLVYREMNSVKMMSLKLFGISSSIKSENYEFAMIFNIG